MKRKPFITIFIILITSTVFSQNYLGINTMAIGLSSKAGDFGGTGFGSGLIFNRNISDFISINSSLNYNKANFSNTFECRDDNNNKYSKKIKLRPDYLRFSIYPILYFSESPKRLRSFFGLGLEMAYLLQASFVESWTESYFNLSGRTFETNEISNSYEIDFVDDKNSEKRNEIYKDDINRTEIGWSFVGGFEIERFLHGLFRVEFKYGKTFNYSFHNQALEHISSEWDVNEFKISRISVALMYLYKF